MKLFLSLLLCVFNTVLIHAQQKNLTGKVVDESGKAIKYVSIGFQNTPIGTVSNEEGEFKLKYNPDSLKQLDSLKFTIIGYHPVSIPLKKLQKEKELRITLTEKFVSLSEVIITPYTKNKTKGTHGKSLLNLFVNFALEGRSNQNLGSEIGRRFSIGRKGAKIEAFKFFVASNNFDSIKFRFNIYSIKHGKPDENILKENIYIDLKKKATGWIELDLAPYGIVVNENIIVALEWVAKSKGNVLSLPIVMPTPHSHFYKYGSQNKWKRFNLMSTFMELTIAD